MGERTAISADRQAMISACYETALKEHPGRISPQHLDGIRPRIHAERINIDLLSALNKAEWTDESGQRFHGDNERFAIEGLLQQDRVSFVLPPEVREKLLQDLSSGVSGIDTGAALQQVEPESCMKCAPCLECSIL